MNHQQCISTQVKQLPFSFLSLASIQQQQQLNQLRAAKATSTAPSASVGTTSILLTAHALVAQEDSSKLHKLESQCKSNFLPDTINLSRIQPSLDLELLGLAFYSNKSSLLYWCFDKAESKSLSQSDPTIVPQQQQVPTVITRPMMMQKYIKVMQDKKVMLLVPLNSKGMWMCFAPLPTFEPILPKNDYKHIPELVCGKQGRRDIAFVSVTVTEAILKRHRARLAKKAQLQMQQQQTFSMESIIQEIQAEEEQMKQLPQVPEPTLKKKFYMQPNRANNVIISYCGQWKSSQLNQLDIASAKQTIKGCFPELQQIDDSNLQIFTSEGEHETSSCSTSSGQYSVNEVTQDSDLLQCEEHDVFFVKVQQQNKKCV